MVYFEDEEVYEFWVKKIGIFEERIICLEGNFWDIGEGLSGLNMEIFYDCGEVYGNDLEDLEFYSGGENDCYLEVWNFVFFEFNYNFDGMYMLFLKKNIDMGMGFERMVFVIQNVLINFDIDLFVLIIKVIEIIFGEIYGIDNVKDIVFKVIVDYIRMVVFVVSDGVFLLNEGCGYVLRCLLCWVVCYVKMINIYCLFMYDLVLVVVEIMVDFYFEVKEKLDFIVKVIKNEEECFYEIFNEGFVILLEMIKKEKDKGSSVILGVDVFKLYDMYGFLVELIEEYVEDENMMVDYKGFEEEMNQQCEWVRNVCQDVGSMQVQGGVLCDVIDESIFVGYF